MKYLSIVLLISVISQDVQQVSETKRDVAYGQDCDDTEYRNEWGTPNWKTMVSGYPNVTQSVP